MANNNKKNSDRQDATETADRSKSTKPNPPWFKFVMFGLMAIGLLWIIVFYISFSAQWPIPALGQGNILVGFGILMVGFLMTTRWR